MSTDVMNDERVPHRLTFVWKRCEDCALVISPNGDRVLLDPLATRLWQLIDDRRTISELKEALAAEGKDPLRVDDLLAMMVRERVLTYETFLWSQG